MRDSEVFAKYHGPAMGYYVTQYKQDLASIMCSYRDNHLAFATFTDPDNFFDDHEIYLQIKDKKRFLQCLFFEVLLDQALYTAGFMPKERDGCLYGSVKVVHILAAAGAMVNPYFLLLAASRWSEDSEEVDKDFEQLCWLFEREVRRTLKGLWWELYSKGSSSPYFRDQEWPRPFRHNLVQDDIARLMRYHGDVDDLLRTGYFSGRQDFANREVFAEWVSIMDHTITDRVQDPH